MGQLYTSGDWFVKEGSEDEFVAAWEDLALWTQENIEGVTWASLLRDEGNPQLFRSLGPWESKEAIAAWRGTDGFKERVVKIKEFLERFEAHTMEAVVEVS
ncbi:MAG: antibiotic biosynthesis monooxygenase family protein [Actinomycetota bacterium]